ncbi:MAG: glycosyltransferase family 4 protein [Steroidobacteraceae bacterium]
MSSQLEDSSGGALKAATAFVAAEKPTIRSRLANIIHGLAGSGMVGGTGLFPWVRRRLMRLANSFHPLTLIYRGEARLPQGGPHALLVSNDLSASGAPKIIFEIAQILHASGFQVAVLSGSDGPFRTALTAAGISSIVDPNVFKPDAPIVMALAAASDFAICNTVLTAPVVRSLSPMIPTYWYIHEVSLVSEMLAIDPTLAPTFALPMSMWSGSELSAAEVRPFRRDIKILPYGLDPLLPSGHKLSTPHDPIRIAIFGSIERRKGQDIALEAIALLPVELRQMISLSIYGRVLDATFARMLRNTLKSLPEVTIHGELAPEAYRRKMLECDAVLISSRDDTLPLVSLDALGAGRVLMCTPTTGTSAYLSNGVDGFVAGATDAQGMAAMITDAILRRDSWPKIGIAAQKLFALAFSKEAFAARLRAEIEPAIRSSLAS